MAVVVVGVVAVGIDPSLTSTGLAAQQVGGLPVSQAVQVHTRGVQRLLDIRQRVIDWVAEAAPQVVAMEGYSMAPRAGRLADLGELGGVIKVALWEKGFREEDGTLLIVPPALLKKFAVGAGNADKGQVRVAAFKRWGVEADTDDEVDAFVLARIGLAVLGADPDLTGWQREVVDRICGAARACGGGKRRKAG